MRKLIGTAAGIVMAIVVILLIEIVGAQVYPIPDGVEMGDIGSMATMVAAMPFGAKAVVVGGWFLGALVGSFVAFRTAWWEPSGWIVAAIVAAGGIANVMQIPHPLWMQLSAVAMPFVGAVFGYGLYRRWN